MKLNLTKPLIVFDLETTGLDMIKDRIIQISYIKVMPDGTEDRKNLYVNPCKEIPAEVVALTGISNEDVKDAPTFKQLAATLEKDFTGCDFAGYNSNQVLLRQKDGGRFRSSSCRSGYRGYLPRAHGRARQVCSRRAG